MRKKAENKIRQAVAKLDRSEFYRIDKVREKAEMIRKVFDKTILDMARVGTIELTGGDTRAMSASEIGNLIHYGDELYVYFKFIKNVSVSETLPLKTAEPAKFNSQALKPEDPEPEKIEIILMEIAPEIWRQFESLCKKNEGKHPLQKLQEMIRDYNLKEVI